MRTRRALLFAAGVGLLVTATLLALQGRENARTVEVPAPAPPAAPSLPDEPPLATPNPVEPAASAPPAAPAASTLVDLHDVAPDVRIDLRYAGDHNFLHQTLYAANRCLLQPGTAARIASLQQKLAEAQLVLVVWDCYRPLSVQRRMWEAVRDPRYVADPKEGSKHNRGAAVDVTLADLGGAVLDMGTDHDDFSERAHRDFTDLPAEALRNRTALTQLMANEGFVPLPTEWWHFDDPQWQDHPLLDEPIEARRADAAR